MLQIIEQFQTAAPGVSHAKELYGIAAIFATQIGLAVVAHVKGRRRTPELGRELDKRFEPVMGAVTTLSGEVRDLKAHVIGPDGQNGLRGDVKELKTDVKGLLDRERDKLHGPYDRRTA